MSHPYQRVPAKRPLSRAVVFFVPFFIFVASLVGAGIYSVRLITEIQGEVGRELFPGEVTWRVPEEGEYVVWFHPRITFDGQRYEYVDELPTTVALEVMDEATNKTLYLEESKGSEITLNKERAVTVAKFEAPREMNVIFSVTGDDTPRVFSIAPPKALRFVKNLGMVIGLILGGTALSFVAFIILYLIRKSPGATSASPPTPPPPPLH